MFPSPGILQHYIEFDTHTINMLEKLLGGIFLGISISHLARHQTIFFVYLGMS
jgi:hypothetical protein